MRSGQIEDRLEKITYRKLSRLLINGEGFLNLSMRACVRACNCTLSTSSRIVCVLNDGIDVGNCMIISLSKRECRISNDGKD